MTFESPVKDQSQGGEAGALLWSPLGDGIPYPNSCGYRRGVDALWAPGRYEEVEIVNQFASNQHPKAVLQPLPPRERSQLVATVTDALREAIIHERLPTGSRLNQVQIAENLNVSRMPVREAIAALISEGLVEPLPTTGVVVKPLSREDVQDVYKVRIALETEAARTVIEDRAATGANRLQAVLSSHKLSSPHSETPQLLEVDREFHRARLDSTGNPYFVRALVPVWSVVERAMYTVLQVPEIISSVWEEHEAIAQAIADRDAVAAEMRIRQHLGHGAAAISSLLADREAVSQHGG